MLNLGRQSGLFVQILWHGFYPWDVRLEKFMYVIQSLGLKIGIIGRNVNAASNTEYISGSKIQRIGLCQSIFNKALNYPLFCNPIFIAKAERLLKHNRPALLIVRDLPLGMLAIYLGIRHKIPVLFDMAENYPAALLAYENTAYKSFLFGNALLPRLYERIVICNVDAVIVVALEQTKRLIAMGVKPSKIFLIKNTPDRNFIESAARSVESTAASRLNFKPMILYIGKIDIHRGIRSLIEAFSLIVQRVPEAGLVIVGDGKEKAMLKSFSKQMNLGQKVIFTDWINHTELPSFIKKADICCIPHLKSEHTDTTLPNKLFDYMAFGKPILVSNLEPLKRIVKKVQCGLVFKSGDATSLAGQALTLIEQVDLAEMGARGINAIKNEYNWEKDANELKKVLKNLLKI